MARDEDQNSAGSQFFINLGDNERLNGRYTVFGDVIDGMDVVDAIAGVDCNPLEPVTHEGKQIDIGGRPVNKDDARILKATVMW